MDLPEYQAKQQQQPELRAGGLSFITRRFNVSTPSELKPELRAGGLSFATPAPPAGQRTLG